MGVDKEQVWEVLKTCYDPEIPINIVDLGLIYDLKVDEGKVYVKMTMTAPGCPAADILVEDVKQKVGTLDGVEAVDVEVVWVPPWNPDMMSEEAKKALGWI